MMRERSILIFPECQRSLPLKENQKNWFCSVRKTLESKNRQMRFAVGAPKAGASQDRHVKSRGLTRIEAPKPASFSSPDSAVRSDLILFGSRMAAKRAFFSSVSLRDKLRFGRFRVSGF